MAKLEKKKRRQMDGREENVVCTASNYYYPNEEEFTYLSFLDGVRVRVRVLRAWEPELVKSREERRPQGILIERTVQIQIQRRYISFLTGDSIINVS